MAKSLADGILAEWMMTPKQRTKLLKVQSDIRTEQAVVGQKLSEGAIQLDQMASQAYQRRKVTTVHSKDANGNAVETVTEELVGDVPPHIHNLVVSQSAVPGELTKHLKKD